MRRAFGRMRESFWLIPGVAIVAAVLLGVVLVEVDAHFAAHLARDWPRLFGVDADGARSMLSSIASSMITVAGVVFSVTIVSLSLAASAYSPRVLRTFMRDRVMQSAFGAFVGIFVYCLVVLRTVRAEDSGQTEAFVPSIAVLGALVLALGGVWVLVTFIHHVASAIQASTILERIAEETRGAIDQLFPDQMGEGEQDADEQPAIAERDWRAVPAQRSGYIVAVYNDALLEFARSRGAVVRMDLAVGDFAIESQPLASLAGGKSEGKADAEALAKIFVIDAERNIGQDAAFGLQQILDVAARALSPGINSPSLATTCIDHLGELLVRLAGRRVPSRLRHEGGELRVIATGPTFEKMVDFIFEPLVQYAAGKQDVLEKVEEAARAVAHAAPAHRKLALRRHLEAIECARRT